jgi:hypothetical protein
MKDVARSAYVERMGIQTEDVWEQSGKEDICAEEDEVTKRVENYIMRDLILYSCQILF